MQVGNLAAPFATDLIRCSLLVRVLHRVPDFLRNLIV